MKWFGFELGMCVYDSHYFFMYLWTNAEAYDVIGVVYFWVQMMLCGWLRIKMINTE